MSGGEEIPAMQQFPWHAKDKDACFRELGLNPDVQRRGLTTSEAAARLEKHGPNKITTTEKNKARRKKKTLLARIYHQVANVFVGILVLIAIVFAVRAARSYYYNTDAYAIQVVLIVVVIAINTCIGVVQEGSAERAAAAADSSSVEGAAGHEQAMLSGEAAALLIRDGERTKIPADRIVPGDIVVLGLGDRIPADLRMLEVGNLAVREAALTGESSAVPVDKTVDAIEVAGDPTHSPLCDRHNMCFATTFVAQGSGLGLVCATGDRTEIGTINASVNNQIEQKKTKALRQIDTASLIWAVFIAITAIVTFLVAFFMIALSGRDALYIVLVVAVAMIPEGLKAIVTVTYARAVSNLAKKHNAVIRALPAVETLGSVTTICSDKAGTLTQDIMSLAAFVTSDKRYRFDFNARDRTPNNFVVDNGYLSERAGHSKQASTSNTTATTFASGGGSPDSAFLRRALSGGILCSKCSLGEGGSREGEIGSPAELSILRAAYFGGVPVSEVKDSAPIFAEVPFSSEYKFMATVHNYVPANDTANFDGKLIVHAKGAPDRMIPLCKTQARGGSLDEQDAEPIDRNYWIEQVAILGSHGLRVLALTRGTLETGAVTEGEQLGPEFVNRRAEPWLTLVGLCAIMDPPRPECVRAISEARRAGIRVAMITGDDKDAALAVGRMLGIVDKKRSSATTGLEMDALSDEELKVVARERNVFARASPRHKIRIVRALQAEGEVVCCMTGDCAQDAPALKAADIGVAMGKEGTDVAREAADMILAADCSSLATINRGAKEGRAVWDNLQKVLLVNASINNAQGMSVLFGMIMGLSSSPLSTVQVLYCNLICAVTLGFVPAVEPAEGGIMKGPPPRGGVGKRLIDLRLLLRIVLGTAALVCTTVHSVFWAMNLRHDLPAARSQALNVLSFGAIALTASARFSRQSVFHCRSFVGNPIAWWCYIIVAALQVVITYTPGLNHVVFSMGPMDGKQWAIVFLYMIVVLVVMELEKAVCRYFCGIEKYEDADDRDYGMVDNPPEKPVKQPPRSEGASSKGASEI